MKKIILLQFIFSLCSIISAQDYLFDVQIINIENGLPNRRVFDVAQDKNGFIWISTPGKISRYDGQQFKTYDAEFLNIPDYTGVTISFDKNNNLWYCVNSNATPISYAGVLDVESNTVYKLEEYTENQFSSKEIIHINRSAIAKSEWFLTTRGGKIYKYDGSFEEIFHYPKKLTSRLSAQQHVRGNYWVMHKNELIKVVNQQAEQTFRLPFVDEYPIYVNKIIQQNPVLIESHHSANGFQYKQLEGEQLVDFTIKNNQTDEIVGLLHTTSDYLVFATKEALVIQDMEGNTIFQFEDFDNKGFGSVKIKSNNTYLDRQNILWLATENGLIKIVQKKNPFTQLFPKNSTRGIYLDEVNQLRVGGYKGNIQKDLKTATEKIFFESTTFGRPPVMSFYKDSKSHIWAGTSARLLLEYHPEQEEPIEHESKQPGLLYMPYENPITKTLWIGTNHGLLHFDRSTNQFVPYVLPIASLNIEVRQFYSNKVGLWIITNKGIFLIDQVSEKVMKYFNTASGLPNQNITHLQEDKEGIFWLASKGGGLIRWDVLKNEFRQFTQENGLSNNTLYAVYEDDYEHLWLPSDYGLMCFDKNIFTTQVYLPQNGIAHEEFNTFSHYKAADGKMYFGGLNGVTSFHPKEVLQNKSQAPPLHITKVRILEEDQEDFSDKTTIFQNENRIELNHNHRILEIELSLLDYAQSAKNQYAYQIEGYQDQWIYTRENKISLINLPYGKFTLRLKGRGASGSWSDKVLDIPLMVKTPFYLQWWFISLTLITLMIGVFASIRWRISSLEKDRERLETEVKKRTLQIEKDKTIISEQAAALYALDKAKTRFFSNITHEFRTPLTLIIGPLQQMIKAPKETITNKQLRGVLYNAKNILKLINQLLDISKLEDGKMKMEITRGNINQYTQTIINGFDSLAQKKNHRIIFLTPQNNWETHFDKEKWDKIIYNLLFNAIKFTPPFGVIQIALRKIHVQEKEWIYLKVRDSGIGIAENQVHQIFNRFYQADDSTTRLQEGTGIGLSLVKELVELQNGIIKVSSKVGKGTSFEVQLPVHEKEHATLMSFAEAPNSASIPMVLERSEQSNSVAQPSINQEKLSLLIIEDNDEMRAYIQSCVPPSEYAIITAMNGVDGIQKAQSLIPDLIISDVMMPLKDGFEVTQTIRGHIATSHIPIILLTAKAALESKLEGLKRGADVYLTKPFSPEELTLRVQKLIEIRQLLQKRYESEQILEPTFNQIKTYDSEDVFIIRLRKFILNHIDNTDLNGAFIAKDFKISRMQLHRKLKALTNQSTTEFIQSTRLEVAFDLLQQKKLNVSEVAFQTGFNSLTHFTRKFKQKYQITPSKVLK